MKTASTSRFVHDGTRLNSTQPGLLVRPPNEEPMTFPVRVSETDGDYAIENLPGVKPEDINISIQNNVVTVTAQREALGWDRETVRTVAGECGCGKLVRSFVLATPVSTEDATVTYQEGVLRLTLPKRVMARAH